MILNRTKILDFFSLSVIAMLSAYVYGLSLVFRNSISGDFPYYVQFAQGLSPDPQTFDPMGVWPLGYPLVLRMFSGLGSWNEVGSLVSFLSFLTVGLSAFFLLRTGFPSIPAFLGALVSVFNPPAIKYAVGHSSDLPALGLAFACLAFFAHWYKSKSTPLLFCSGLFAGFAYLTRYSSLSILLSLFLVLFLFRGRWRLFSGSGLLQAQARPLFEGFILFLGWLLAASPQLIGSLLVHGNPLYTENGCNVALALGWNQGIPGLTWLNVKDNFPQCESILGVILKYPADFFANYFRNIGSSLGLLRFQLLAGFVCIYLAFRPNQSDSPELCSQHKLLVLLMLINAGAVVLINSLAFVSDRHLVLATSIVNATSAAVVSYYLMRGFANVGALKGSFLALPLALVASLSMLFDFTRTIDERKKYRALSSETKKNEQVANTLASFECIYVESDEKGAIDTVLVGDDFVDPSSFRKIGVQEWRRQYKPFQDLASAKKWMQANGFKCIVLDESSLGGRIPGVDSGPWKQEYERGLLFARRWSSERGKTFVFAID